MRSYHIEAFGSIDNIRIREHDLPEPGPSDVLIRIRAASLARRDIKILQQTYPLPGRPDVIPLSDGAGEVIAVGDAVSKFKIGDRVAGSYFPHWRDGKMGMDVIDQLGCTLDGMLTEYVLLEENALVLVPAHLSWEEASTLPCAAVTAWSTLTGPRPVKAGDTVVTIGSGGVAVFAIQFANMLGARVISLTSRDAKIEGLQRLGAHHVINYRSDPNWYQQILALTDGNGADLIAETGGTDTLEQSSMAACFGGEITLISPVGTINPGAPTPLNKILISLFVRYITLRPVFVGSRLAFEAMNRAVTLHKMKPLIDTIFSFDQARDAYHYLAKGEHFGKVVISF